MVRTEHIYLCVHEKSFSYPIEHENLFLRIKYKQSSFSTFPTPVLMLFLYAVRILRTSYAEA